MRIPATLFLCALSLALTGQAAGKPKTTKKTEKAPVSQTAPQVKLHTTLGDVVIKLDDAKAPVTVQNFLSYVKDGHFDGTLFHRVIPGFMAQGGGFTEKWQQKPTKTPIKNEADNGLLNKRGTIAMARTSDPQSATAQFFINYKDNDFLDYKSPTPQGWGYTVFGEVVQGMDVVDKMATVPTGRGGPMPSDVPQTTIVIEKASVVEAK
jgi:cyclophilin family peptidyl-prolyl cis-trans isomerase